MEEDVSAPRADVIMLYFLFLFPRIDVEVKFCSSLMFLDSLEGLSQFVVFFSHLVHENENKILLGHQSFYIQ